MESQHQQLLMVNFMGIPFITARPMLLVHMGMTVMGLRFVGQMVTGPLYLHAFQKVSNIKAK